MLKEHFTYALRFLLIHLAEEHQQKTALSQLNSSSDNEKVISFLK